MRIAVGIPTVLGHNHCVAEHSTGFVYLSEGVEPDVLLIDNGGNVDPAKLDPRVTVEKPGRNLGVAGSWNRACHWAFDERAHDYCCLLNDDCDLVQHDTLACLIAESQKGKRLVYLGMCGFSCFLITKTILTQIGEFDSEFHPAYFEDNDYSYRCRLGGIQVIGIGGTVQHHGSATMKHDDVMAALVKSNFTKNAQRYVRKWGGEPHEERFTVPFGK